MRVMTTNQPRVWLITGASSGFGRAIAEAALAAGDIVVAAARRTDALADLVASAPERVTALALDVTDGDRISAAVAEVLDGHGRVDVLVNNAGRGAIGAAEETSDRELRDLMDLHFFGPAALTRAVLPGMRERGTGAIVQMSSMGGRFTFPGVGAYSATKFALEGWSEALAKEVERFGVRVLIVEPGAFRTSFNGPGALLMSQPIPAYDEQIEPLRTGMPDDDGKQPGDPAKAAAAILQALDSADPPLRLALGNDAVDAIAESLDNAKAELAAWERLGRSAVFD
jgi:NAD(P)-dependent dehydrogenase (short-subunit alcohol dehydrogenase family)